MLLTRRHTLSFLIVQRQDYSSAILTVHRSLSLACLRTCQFSGVDAGDSWLSDDISSDRSRDPHFHLPRGCQPYRMRADIFRTVSLQEHLPAEAGVVSLPVPEERSITRQAMSARLPVTTNDVLTFLKNELSLPATLDRPSTLDRRRPPPRVVDTPKEREGAKRASTTESCAPHAALAGYAKCATSTLQ